MDARIIDALRPLTTSFEEMGVPYEISGSIASSLHGVPRSSIDADLLAALEAAHVPELARKLQARYYLSETRMADAVSRGASFNLIHFDSMLKLDVFVAKSDRFLRESLARRTRHSLGGEPLPLEVFVATAEDIVLHKLRWFRKGGQVSTQQWQDVAGVLRVQAGRLDSAYLDRWAQELGVGDLLAKAFEETT